jgi:cytochrome c oxidase subunit 2
MVFMFYAIVVFRRRDGDESDGEHFEGNTALEIAWTVIPLLVVVVFSYIGISTFNTVTQKNEDLVVNVTGFQWAWSFEYADGVVSPELVLPVNQRAKMAMTSSDVLHSFWVPEFRVKQDLVPGQTTELYFTPTVEGEYKLRCAELCGLTHWNMLATVRVVGEDEYAMWISEQLAQQSPAVADGSGN